MTNICTAPVYELKELNNIFIELTAKNCTHRCSSCYIKFNDNFSINKTIKDFIPIEKVKEALCHTKQENLHCIYLTGAEPMTHPDFNSILRLCLKRCNVCICTSGSSLNEKKIRFLNKVENESENQIFFKLSLTHFDELENDKSKYRGNYRQTLFVLKTLERYNFISILTIQNLHNLKENEIKDNFEKIFSEHEIKNTDLKIICSHPDFEEKHFMQQASKTDCMYSRTISNNGIYACPFLASDYRGRVGSSFQNYSKSFMAETDFCATCSKNNDFIFTIG